MQNSPNCSLDYQKYMVSQANNEYKSKTFVQYIQPQSFINTNEYPHLPENCFKQIHMPKYSYPLAPASTTCTKQIKSKNISPFLNPLPYNDISNRFAHLQINPQYFFLNSQQIQQNKFSNYVYLQETSPQQPYFGLLNNSTNNNNKIIRAVPHVKPIIYFMPISHSMEYSQQYNPQLFQTPHKHFSYSSASISSISQNNPEKYTLNMNRNNPIANINASTCGNGVSTKTCFFKPKVDVKETNTCPKTFDSFQTIDMSVVTDIPGSMAYHHPLIPIIPSASGNTRKMKMRLLKFKTNGTFHNINNKLVKESQSSELLDKPFKKEYDSNIKTAWKLLKWTQEEDKLLEYLRQTEKIGWRDISMYFPTRTINACKFRWRRLSKMEENRNKRELQKIAIKENLGKFQKKSN